MPFQKLSVLKYMRLELKIFILIDIDILTLYKNVFKYLINLLLVTFSIIKIDGMWIYSRTSYII